MACDSTISTGAGVASPWCSCPPAGYDTPTFATDVLAVLDSLGLERVTLVGHSLGGAEAVWLAVHHPERVRRVVLLESYCSSCPQATPPHTSPPPGTSPGRPKATPADLRTANALRAYSARVTMAPTPVSEIAATHAMHPDGYVGPRTAAPTAMASALELVMRSEIARIRQPVLLILAIPETPEDAVPWARPLIGSTRAWAEWSLQLGRARQRGWAALFQQAKRHSGERPAPIAWRSPRGCGGRLHLGRPTTLGQPRQLVLGRYSYAVTALSVVESGRRPCTCGSSVIFTL